MNDPINAALLQDVEEAAKEIFRDRNEVDVVYLYGSVLTSRKFNDIDIGLLVDEEFSPHSLYEAEIIMEFEKRLRGEFDVRILNGRPVRFLSQVFKKSRVIFCRDECHRIAFEKRVMIDYFDIKYHYDLYDSLRRERYAKRDIPIKD
ncbi:MAG: nucleotidyltransferase domain-containing protein [Candidatus Thorarchaeota archaeon]|nr:nucleotidyltransferase domain-containing protein [Candidatus Thorarchaeota archaeon]